MTENTPFAADADEEEGNPNQQKIILAGVAGAVVVGVGAFLLLSGGGSSDSSASSSVVPRGKPAAAAASPTATASPDAAVPTTNVAGNDPFQVPTRILQALAPAVAPVAATSSSAASPSPGATTDSGTPGDSASGGGGGSTAPNVQFVQLLGAKKSGSKWAVTVRTNHGTCTGIKEGTAKVCGTDFTFANEDESSGKPTFVFVFGEVQGGNLTPDAKQKATPVKAGKSALVAVNGKVDGGLDADS